MRLLEQFSIGSIAPIRHGRLDPAIHVFVADYTKKTRMARLRVGHDD
jgi:hypothetical protein